MCVILKEMKSDIRKYIAIIMILTGMTVGYAQTGRNAYSFLELPTSSHAMGFGGSGISIIDSDVTLADQNPALIGPELGKQVAFNYMLYMGTSNFAGIRYGMEAGEHGAWAAGIRYLNYGKLTQYEPDGTAGGTFSPQDVVFEGTYSHDFTYRLRGGINFKMIYSNYEQYSAFAMAVDLGINYYDDEKNLSLSAVLKNMGGQLKRFDKNYDRLPFDFQLGYMQQLGSSSFSLGITARHLTRWKLPYYTHGSNPDEQQVLKSTFFSNFFRHLIFGLQFKPSDKFYVDLGYNYKQATDMSVYHRSVLLGFTVGMGLRVKGFDFGVSYAMPHKSASSLNFNIACSLDELM